MSEEPLSSACLYGLNGWQNFLPDMVCGYGNTCRTRGPKSGNAAVAQSGQSAESPSASSGTITMPRKSPQACFRRRKLVSLNAERLPRKNKPRSEDAGSSPARRFFLGGPGSVLGRGRGEGLSSRWQQLWMLEKMLGIELEIWSKNGAKLNTSDIEEILSSLLEELDAVPVVVDDLMNQADKIRGETDD